MPKAGRYEYPSRDLDSCMTFLQQAYEIAKNYVFKRSDFAHDLKMSPTSGGFGMLVSSMAMYGLIETGGGDIRYTDLTKSILHGEPNEREQAKEKAIRHIAIIGEIYDRFGANVTDEQLRHFLRERAVVEISEANSLAIEIGKLLKKLSPYLKQVEQKPTESGGEKKDMVEGEKPQDESLTGNVLGELRTKEYGVLKLTDDLSLSLAEQIVRGLKEKMSKPK